MKVNLKKKIGDEADSLKIFFGEMGKTNEKITKADSQEKSEEALVASDHSVYFSQDTNSYKSCKKPLTYSGKSGNIHML